MPTKRTLRQRHRREALTEFQVAFLLDRPLPPESTEDCWWRVVSRHHEFGPDYGPSLWAANREQLLADHVCTDPGTRPSTWWKIDAPSPRQRLGGIGTPSHEALKDAPAFWCGIPARWITARQVEYYTGRALDIHGKPIGTQFVGRKFAGVAIDPRDPPLFEAQPTFLQRLGLLLPGELRRLKPADFAPERVLPELDDVSASGHAH